MTLLVKFNLNITWYFAFPPEISTFVLLYPYGYAGCLMGCIHWKFWVFRIHSDNQNTQVHLELQKYRLVQTNMHTFHLCTVKFFHPSIYHTQKRLRFYKPVAIYSFHQFLWFHSLDMASTGVILTPYIKPVRWAPHHFCLSMAEVAPSDNLTLIFIGSFWYSSRAL